MGFTIRIVSGIAASLFLSACASHEYMVAGTSGGSIYSGGNGTWVSCAPCELYAYDARTGAITPIGSLSDDAATLSYLPGSMGYAHGRISFLGSKNGNGSDAAIYTVDASSGRTLQKTPYDFAKYGYGETLVGGDGGAVIDAMP